MFWLSLSFVAYGLCFTEIHARLGESTLSPLNALTIVSYTCRSDVDLTIQHITTNETKTIAQCKMAINACYLLDQAFGQYYGVSYTGDGAIFNVISGTEKTRGAYWFFETQNDSTCVIMKTGSQNKNSTKHQSEVDVHLQMRNTYTEKSSVKETEEASTRQCDSVDGTLDIVTLVLVVVIVIHSFRDLLAYVYNVLAATCQHKPEVEESYPMCDPNKIEDDATRIGESKLDIMEHKENRTTVPDIKLNTVKALQVEIVDEISLLSAQTDSTQETDGSSSSVGLRIKDSKETWIAPHPANINIW